MPHTDPTIIGRTDKANFAKINLTRIKVKIDTGAYTSSFHCCEIDETPDKRLRVIFLDPEHPKYTGAVWFFDTYSKKNVRSSNNETEDRFIISTDIRFHEMVYTAEFSLTNRGEMKYPVLMGRKFLAENNFIVDPTLRNHLYKMRRAAKRPLMP
ncbi:MAG: RimK/LysX family protein [Pyrinomonadaceae bacterium]